MPRPPKRRDVEFIPEVRCFKPNGIPLRNLSEIKLGVDELEALRLKEMEGLSQHECAERMNLAQSTFQRILSSARRKVANALVESRALRIEGGNYRIVKRDYVCSECGFRWRVEPAEASEAPQECPECETGKPRPRWGSQGRHRRGRGRARNQEE